MKTQIFLLLLVSSASIFPVAYTEKILVLSFFSPKSHKMTYMRLIEELANRGHEITVVSPVKSTKEVKNIKEIYTFDSEKIFRKDSNAFEMKKTQKAVDPLSMIRQAATICRMSYDLPQVKALLNEKFDLVFIQPMFNECAFGIIYRLQVPFVMFSVTSVPAVMVSRIGGDYPSSITPNFFLGCSDDEMTFYQRFLNFGLNLIMNGGNFYNEASMTAIYREKLGEDIPSVSEIYANASLMLSNGHFSLSKPKPNLPDVIDVGGIHSRPAKPLPKDLEDFVSKSGKDGFILFSMGSVIKTDEMPEEKRKMFLKVFSKLKQQVLWKWESETMPDLPKNVKLSKWLPQQDLLGHPNIRMFITHCGGGSTEEAIYHGVPLLGMPMMGDQPMNAKQAEMHGFIHTLDWNDVTEESFSNGINEVLNNPKYLKNVQSISRIFKDQIDDPLQRGVYWVEYVMRHKGAPHLRSASRKLNYFQYHSWDVIGAYLGIIFGIIYITVSILKCIFRKMCGSKISSKLMKEKKN